MTFMRAGTAVVTSTALALALGIPLSNPVTADAGAAAAAPSAATAESAARASSGFFNKAVRSIGDASVAAVVGLGVNELFSLAFPGPNYQQELEDIQASINQGFAETTSEFATVESQLKSLQSAVMTNETLTAQALCGEAISGAERDVATIQQAWAGYITALSPAWLRANIDGQTGTSVLSTVGNEAFGAGPGVPSFGSGLTNLRLATTNLANSLSKSQDGILPACADAVAANVASQSAGNGSPQTLGTLETRYFTQMQQITATYASWVNLGATLTLVGGQMSVVVLSPSAPATAQAAASICSGISIPTVPSTNSCGGLFAFAGSIDKAVDAAWGLTGMSWQQATGGTIQTALGQEAATGFFSGGSTPWLTDIAKYGNPSTLPTAIGAGIAPVLSPRGGPTLSSLTTPSVADPQTVSLTSASNPGSLTTPSWGGLTFSPANSAQWDQLLGLINADFYPGAGAPTADFSDCLPDQANSNTATSCIDPQGALGNRLAAAGLLNGGQPVGGNLILYTGETATWNPQVSSLPAAIAYYNNSGFPANVPEPTVATYLDTSSIMVAGRTVAINNPNGQAGSLTSSDMYPFGYNVNGIGQGPQSPVTTVMALSQTASLPDAEQSTGVQCSDGSYPYGITGQTLMQFLNSGAPVGNGNATTLDCQGNGWNAPGNSSTTPVASTANQSFYAEPQLTFVYVRDGDDDPRSQGMFACTNAPTLGSFPTESLGDLASGVRGLPCPANPFIITSGTASSPAPSPERQPGWIIGPNTENGGTSLNPEAHYGWPVVNTQASGCVTTSNTVTQGTTGTIGAPNVCANFFAPYAADKFGVDTGSLSTSIEPTIGPKASGAQSINVLVTNTSSTSQLGTFTVELGRKGNIDLGQAAGVTIASGGSPTTPLNGCSLTTFKGQQVLTCTGVTFSTGSTTVSIPVSGTKGSVEVLIQGNGNYAAGEGLLRPGRSSTTSPPGPIEGLAASVTASTTAGSSQQVTLSWTTPPSTPVPLSGYVLNATKPDGTKIPTQKFSTSRVSSADGSSSIKTRLPESGQWSISLAAVNQFGFGPAATINQTLGSGPPPAPTNLTAKELPNARVLLVWTPVAANPALDSYVITSTSPSGVVRSYTPSTTASYATESLNETGNWTFSVAARNSLGTSTASTVQVSVVGSVSSAPEAVTARVTAGGFIDLTWAAPANAVPPPSSYEIYVYAPNATSASQPTYYLSVPSAGITSTISIPALYRLGSNSTTGMWNIFVRPVNSTGNGVPARTGIFVNSNLLQGLGAAQALATDVVTIPATLRNLEEAECAGGVTSVPPATGSCKNGIFTPTAG